MNGFGIPTVDIVKNLNLEIYVPELRALFLDLILVCHCMICVVQQLKCLLTVTVLDFSRFV